jgi:hypothetical protein
MQFTVFSIDCFITQLQGEDFTEFLRTMKASLDNMSAMAIEISHAMGIDVTSFEVEE